MTIFLCSRYNRICGKSTSAFVAGKGKLSGSISWMQLTLHAYSIISQYIFSLHQITYIYVYKIARRVAPALVPQEDPIAGPNSPLLQLLKLAWGYKEVNDEHTDKVSECVGVGYLWRYCAIRSNTTSLCFFHSQNTSSTILFSNFHFSLADNPMV